MSPQCKPRRVPAAAAAKSRQRQDLGGSGSSRPRRHRTASALLGVWLALLLAPGAASAHGPVDPAASSFLARVNTVAPGVQAQVVDGDQRLWLRVPARSTVVILDYRGAPYLRFLPAGVQVNENSTMYYLNQVPPQLSPSGLGPRTPPRWELVSSGHEYEWHDGRLSALAATALAPGTSYVGRWTVPVALDGGTSIIAGGLYYAAGPSLVWFWPILVVAACVLAALRVRHAGVEERLARVLALWALVAFAVAGAGQQLQGRPNVSLGQLIALAVVAAFTAWGLYRLALRRHGWFTFFAISVAALWEGASLLGVLLHGYVLLALPALAARVAVVACLATGVGLLPIIFRIAERPEPSRAAVVAMALALVGCGSGQTSRPGRGLGQGAIPAALLREARPVGRGPAFAPPARGWVTGHCRPGLGSRDGVHVELFAANRVVLLAAGIGTRPPLWRSEARISHARCYGNLVTLDPTGVVLVRTGDRLALSDLFRAWGQPLSRRRLASFRVARGQREVVFVNGRRRSGPPGRVGLVRHAEIVLEVGPRVPPHPSYTFPAGS